jgi:uncharacterized protein (TIGR02452 family)
MGKWDSIREYRERRIEIFNNTREMYASHPVLIESIKNSIASQRFYRADEEIIISKTSSEEVANVFVTSKRSFEAAEPYAKAGKNVTVLNFADYMNPGGKVLEGANAQEESLNRSSTLYPCISDKSMLDIFYLPHRAEKRTLYSDDCILTPEVIVFKTDEAMSKLLPESEWYKVNVITMAFPNLKYVSVETDKLEKVIESRIRKIFEVVVANGTEVFIGGAIGCGVFKNPPELVAAIFHKVQKEFLHNLDVIEYAIPCGRNKKNYETFMNTMM